MTATRAFAAQNGQTPLAEISIDRRAPGPKDVAIDILYCGVCHSDLHTARGEWGGVKFPSVPTVVLGVLFIVPLCVKQNIGLAFGGAIGLWLVVRISIGLWKKWPVIPYLQMLAGSLAGLAIAGAVIQWTCGIANYKYWTWDFATSRRAPSAVPSVHPRSSF